MSQPHDNRRPYNHDYPYPHDYQDLSYWPAAPGFAMVRAPSGESTSTAYSGDVSTPISENGQPDLWSTANYDPSLSSAYRFSPTYSMGLMSCGSQGIPDTGEYIVNDENNYGVPMEMPWLGECEFIGGEEGPDPQAYYLNPQHTGQPPATGEAEHLSTPIIHHQSKDGMFHCQEPGCTTSSRRKSDLTRHYEQLHMPLSEKPKYPCDWKKCQRAQEPFHRRDHQRDHYRDYHHEDLTRRGSAPSREDQEWWNSRKVNLEWWRCSHCLQRVKLEQDGYTCPLCKGICELARQQYRAR
ncbi:putative egg shell [Rosellinia necatrix]|uniref:Putative egg shell n=1 Tax=Rosellinia necatrix TaxID=77044 RepID=A0A1S7UJ49_ROSNE|nr:putative egg shell [Rosellinia necatrix]